MCHCVARLGPLPTRRAAALAVHLGELSSPSRTVRLRLIAGESDMKFSLAYRGRTFCASRRAEMVLAPLCAQAAVGT